MRAPAKKAPSRKSVPSDIELDIFFKKDGLYYDSEKCNVLIYVKLWKILIIFQVIKRKD